MEIRILSIYHSVAKRSLRKMTCWNVQTTHVRTYAVEMVWARRAQRIFSRSIWRSTRFLESARCDTHYRT